MKELVTASVSKFIEWQKGYGYQSCDQYDFWSTSYGIWSKGLYYKNKYLGIPFVAPIFAAEILCPDFRRAFSNKKRFPIADAHFILAYANLFEYSSNSAYLEEAKTIAENLLYNSIEGYSGYCWGYPFNWMTTRGLWKKGVPLITTTAYCFEAFLKLFDLTREKRYLDIAHSVFHFALNDLKDTYIDDKLSACSYSPIDDSQVINANSYRSFVLVEGYKRFKDFYALEKAQLNINFILENQKSDGSWLYSVSDKRDHFIDNFHTCFVLKNLLKINSVLADERITYAVNKGFEFYKQKLISKDHSPLPFAQLSRLNIVKTEMYDYAEGITLCLNMKCYDAYAKLIAENLVEDVVTKYQKEDGSFVTRINVFNIPNKVPFLRWPQAQLFYALTNYLVHN